MTMLMLADSSSGLDAVSYFFASSAVFFLITGAVFFTFGLWFGSLTWGRYKRRYVKSEEAIESYKNEIAQLKRRLAEKPGRTAAAAHVPPSAPPAALSPLAALVRGNAKAAAGAQETVPGPAAVAEVKLPAGKGYSLWTEAGWEARPVAVTPVPPSAAFTLWTQMELKPASGSGGATMGTTTMTSTHAGDAAWLYTYEHGAPATPARTPKSHAFTIWTEKGWKAHPPKGQAPPRAMAFSLWTLRDYLPRGKGPQWRGQGFTLWTEAGWVPPKISGGAMRSARGFSIWTEDDFEPSGHGPTERSRAWSLWTEASWAPRVVKAAPQPRSAAFSLWAEHVEVPLVTEHGANGSNGVKAPERLPEHDLRKTQGSVFARALAAARSAFKG